MTNEEKVRRADAYKSIVDNPYYGEAVELVRAQLLREFQATTPGEAATRERIYMAIHMLDRVQQTISTVIANGEITRKQIAELNGKKPSVRDFFKV